MPKRKTNEEFISEMKNINPNIEILSEYINNKTKVKCRCLIDNCIWFAIPRHLLECHGCPNCKRKLLSKIKTLDYDEFVKRMNILHPNIKIIGDYVNSKTKMNCECLIDGTQWLSSSANLFIGRGCPTCGLNSLKYGHQEFVDKLQKINPNIEILENYVHSTQKVKCRCSICGYMWFAEPRKLLEGRGCPKCNMSKGEIKISVFLDNNFINYIPQYKFDNCKNINKLSFDFYLPNHNICIEYDGKQHYEAIEYFGGKYMLSIQQNKDKIKTQYCQDNNIKLIRIPYWEFDNIDNILRKELNTK